MTKLETLLLKFQEYMKINGFSPRSVEGYTLELRYFLNFLEELKIQTISEVDRRVLQDYQARVYLQTHKGKPIAPATQHRRLGAVRTFYRYLLKNGLALYDPTSSLDLPKTPKLLPRNILSKKEIGALLAKPNLETSVGIRDRAILELIYTTGIRSSELCNLQLNDLNLHAGELRINLGKGAKDRIVPIGETAGDFLELYLREARPKTTPPDQPFLFVSREGRKLTRSYLHCLIKRYAKKADLPVLGPHAIRHTCATHLLKGKADIRQIQKILGHTSIATTQRYTKVEIGDLKKVLKRCHPREKGEIQVDQP